jgi:hypothetical protein
LCERGGRREGEREAGAGLLQILTADDDVGDDNEDIGEGDDIENSDP